MIAEAVRDRDVLSSRAGRIRMEAAWMVARTDPLYFLKHFVWTIDTHDEQAPIKQFPVRDHIRHIVSLWQDNHLMVIVKSRQMLQTWLFTSLALWDAMFHQGKLILLQSKTEREAVGDPYSGQGLLGRCKFILSQLPDWLVPRWYPKGTQVVFPEVNSTLWAVPQGADIVRSYTCSGILSDECAVQDEFEQAYAAAGPTIRGGGWFVALSTAAPSFFQRLYEDTPDE